MNYWPNSANPRTERRAVCKLGIRCYFLFTQGLFLGESVRLCAIQQLQGVPRKPTVLLTVFFVWFLLKMLLWEGSCSLVIKSLEKIPKWGGGKKKNSSQANREVLCIIFIELSVHFFFSQKHQSRLRLNHLTKHFLFILLPELLLAIQHKLWACPVLWKLNTGSNSRTWIRHFVAA